MFRQVIMSTTKKDFIDWCFKHLDGTEDKYDASHKVWTYLSLENLKLAKKLARLEKLLEEFKLSPPPHKNNTKRKK
jgi:hypothetical protein